jgi:hypothetical protein
MPRMTVLRYTLVACCILALTGQSAFADAAQEGNAKSALAGRWEKNDAEPKLEFTGEDHLTIYPHGDNLDFKIECSYTVSNDGVVKAKITSLDGREDVVEKAKASVPVGLEFQFKWKVEGTSATLESLEGNDVDHIKVHLEGGYAKQP